MHNTLATPTILITILALLAILSQLIADVLAAYKRRKARKALTAAKLAEIKELWYYDLPCTDVNLSDWLESYTRGERGSAPRHDELYKLIMQYFLMHNRHINTPK